MTFEEAWQQAKALLPAGWRLKVVENTQDAQKGVARCYAEAAQPFAQSFIPAGQTGGFLIGRGDTSTAALIMLISYLARLP